PLPVSAQYHDATSTAVFSLSLPALFRSRDVVCLRSKFHPLALPETEYSRQGHIKGPGRWSSNAVAPDISCAARGRLREGRRVEIDRKSTRLNSSHDQISYAVFCLKKKSISTSTLPSIKLRKCSSKIITSILSFISGRLATKSNQIKQLIRNGRSASLQRTFKKSFTSFSHSTRNKTSFFFYRYGNLRDLHSFPTRRSSD